MDNNSLPFKKSADMASRRRRQFWWQILLPVLLASAGMIALAVLATQASNLQISQWGNVSTILVVLPVLLSCLLALVITGAMVYGLGRLLKIMPRIMLLIQIRFYQIEQAVHRAADKVAAPMIKTRSTAAAVRSAFSRKDETAS